MPPEARCTLTSGGQAVSGLPGKLLRVLLPGLLCWLAIAPVAATLMRALSLDELASQADLVVRGRIRSVRVEWNRAANIPITVVDLDVLENLAGEPSPFQRITITQPGGTMDGISLDYAGRPRFHPGQETVLFLNRRRAGRYITVGLAQGKLDLVPGRASGRIQLQRHLAGIELLDAPRAVQPWPADLESLKKALKAHPRTRARRGKP